MPASPSPGHQLLNRAAALTDALATFIPASLEWQKAIADEHHRIVKGPLAEAKRGVLSRTESFSRMQGCARAAEEALAAVCAKQDADVWLSYVRRIPALLDWEPDWVACAALAIIKYAKWTAPTSGGTIMHPGMAMLRLPYSKEVFEDVCQIAMLSRHLALLTSECRWVGKGAVIAHRGNGLYKRHSTTEVDEAVAAYERRRPNSFPWHQIGIVPVPARKEGKDFVLAGVGAFRGTFEVRRAGLKSPTAYFPLFSPAAELADALDPYAKAIEAQFGLPLAAVMHTLIAMTRSIAGRFLPFVDGTTFAFEQDPDDDAGRLGFMMGVFQRGLVSMPEANLRANLARELCPPWSNDPGESAGHVAAFFQTFALTADTRAAIDVVRRVPFYRFLFTSPGGTCYLDLVALAEFFRELVLGARAWAGTLHGDHFSMDVRRLAQRIPGVTVLPKIKGIVYPGGYKGEVDVPLRVGPRLYAVECKAYSLSADLMAGEPVATNNRAQEVTAWVTQAKRVADTLAVQRETVTPKVPGEVREIEWLVCTSGQEYVRPVSKHGSLGTLPRVCTVEELLDHLRERSANG